MTQKHGPIIIVPFENKVSDTAPWNLCGCEECEPMREFWVAYFKKQHDQLYANQHKGDSGGNVDPLGHDAGMEHGGNDIPSGMMDR